MWRPASGVVREIWNTSGKLLFVAKVYGAWRMPKLALEFCQRCHYDIWPAQNDMDYRNSQDELASYAGSPTAVAYPNPTPIEAVILDRLGKIRQVLPTNPG